MPKVKIVKVTLTNNSYRGYVGCHCVFGPTSDVDSADTWLQRVVAEMQYVVSEASVLQAN